MEEERAVAHPPLMKTLLGKAQQRWRHH